MSASNGKHPDTEVRPRTTRRRFTAAYKRKIVEEAARCGLDQSTHRHQSSLIFYAKLLQTLDTFREV
jgi:hypothetical protein